MTIAQLASCSSKPIDNLHYRVVISDNTTQTDSASVLQDTLQVKRWLTEVIEGYTNGVDLKASYLKMRSSLTKEYYEYKQDAINVEYDSPEGSLTIEEFNKKWQGKFDTKFVGKGGFLISSQDNGKVKVTTCILLKNLGDSATIYHVIIDDLDFKNKFIRDIKVIGRSGKLLIADVIEYD
jgi:hypothetical protein